MKLLWVCASLVALAVGASMSMRAQAPEVGVQTTGGVHTAAFGTPQGIISVHVSSDAAAGDTISGMIVAEPAGATPQAREANLGRLNNFVVEWQSQRAPVSGRRYEWLIPVTLRTGSGALSLHDGEGRLVAQAVLPVDPVPAPPPPAPTAVDGFELPTGGEIGSTAVIRGASDGRLTGKALTVGGKEAELLAVSPRQLAFRVPATASGLLPIRFVSDDQVTEGTLRVTLVQLDATRALKTGQQGTLKVTVFGLNGLTEPVTLTILNRSAYAVQVENIDRPVIIAPRQVTAQGTFVVSRRITGGRVGPWKIMASVAPAALRQFDVQRSLNRTLSDWQAKTGVGIAPDADVQIRRSALAAGTQLDDFLRVQEANQGDVQSVFAALLSHYCFDLRDDGRSRRGTADGRIAGPRLMLVALGQNQTSGAGITAGDVGRQSFSGFLSRLSSRFTEQRPVGYLFVSSTPGQAPIALDGRGNAGTTNRRFVLEAGDHTVVVGGRQTCRPQVTVSAFQTKVVNCG